MSPAGRRAVVEYFRKEYLLSERRACRLAGLYRSVQRYQRLLERPGALVERLKALAAERPRFGYRRLTVLLRREGLVVNPSAS